MRLLHWITLACLITSLAGIKANPVLPSNNLDNNVDSNTAAVEPNPTPNRLPGSWIEDHEIVSPQNTQSFQFQLNLRVLTDFSRLWYQKCLSTLHGPIDPTTFLTLGAYFFLADKPAQIIDEIRSFDFLTKTEFYQSATQNTPLSKGFDVHSHLWQKTQEMGTYFVYHAIGQSFAAAWETYQKEIAKQQNLPEPTFKDQNYNAFFNGGDSLMNVIEHVADRLGNSAPLFKKNSIDLLNKGHQKLVQFVPEEVNEKPRYFNLDSVPSTLALQGLHTAFLDIYPHSQLSLADISEYFNRYPFKQESLTPLTAEASVTLSRMNFREFLIQTGLNTAMKLATSPFIVAGNTIASSHANYAVKKAKQVYELASENSKQAYNTVLGETGNLLRNHFKTSGNVLNHLRNEHDPVTVMHEKIHIH